MSASRDDAIKHFATSRYAGMDIGQALRLAPRAVRNGLHTKDHEWISKHSDIDAYLAMQHLYARGLANPDGACITISRP